MAMSLSDRYLQGEYGPVWEAFLARLAAEPDFTSDPDCGAVTFAAFTRMRRNIAAIVAGLKDGGYPFAAEAQGEAPLRATTDKAMNALRKAKAPYAVIAFAEIVGTVDLRAAADGVAEGLGRYDPLVFDPGIFAVDFADKDWRATQEAATPGQMRMEFSPDAFHKANVSGGDGYAVILPPDQPDPHVSPLGITFLTLMRQSIAQGGFWGICGPIFDQADWDEASDIAEGRRLPDSALLKTIQADLSPF